ncbi:hypothetical protein [Deinococcus yavapaiensis]|uniref:Uncharacterized protein n=1 Tax=Deinococcus yavapaiensis KR-236 TaxID=694435 RepID=A0A318SMV6_9DEIO|nr:hypothetical protein [Deinococcus yavapaiensis]PYE56222.1 hypothetical protein DES52_10126 [Deinococcus yavapaiensis KR-236]
MKRYECLSCRHFRFDEGEPTCIEPRNALRLSGTSWSYHPPSSAHTCELHSAKPAAEFAALHSLAAD